MHWKRHIMWTILRSINKTTLQFLSQVHTTRSQRNLTKSRNCERANSVQRILYFDNTENYSWKMGWKMHIKPCLQKPLHAIECDKLWNEKRTIYSLSCQSKPVALAWFCGNQKTFRRFLIMQWNHDNFSFLCELKHLCLMNEAQCVNAKRFTP